MTKRFSSRWAVFLLPFAMAAVSVKADTVITADPGNLPGDQNVLFNQTSLIGTGTTVQGATNQTGTVFDFTSGTTLDTPAKGQARVAASTGTFETLTITPHSAKEVFTTIIFNPDATANGSITITANRLGKSSVSQTLDLSKNGQNYFRVLASNGDELTGVSFTSTVGLSDVSQVRIGGITAVPVPASIWGGLVLLSAGGAWRLRRRATASL